MTGDILREVANNCAMSFLPCSLCKNKTDNPLLSTECDTCCFFYGSKFNPKAELDMIDKYKLIKGDTDAK